MPSWTFGELVLSAFGLASLACFVYLRFALVHGPIAVPNHRSLHQEPIPKGAGVAVALASLICLGALAVSGRLDWRSVNLFVVGGFAVTLAGVADDRLDIPPRFRLVVQLVSIGWICAWLGGVPPLYFGATSFRLGLLGLALLVAACTWFFNLYNFVDGTDGMAGSATAFIGGTMSVVMVVARQYDLAAVLAVVAAASIGFLCFNWPPARIFMGEAGTAFISYIFVAVILVSLSREAVSLWIWLIVFAFYFSDTTVTTMIRAFTVPRFYRGHRSHAYQNLARKWESHLRILTLVLAIDLLWVAPAVAIALHRPDIAGFVTAVVYAPLVLFALKFGPLHADA